MSDAVWVHTQNPLEPSTRLNSAKLIHNTGIVIPGSLVPKHITFFLFLFFLDVAL